jgi:peptide/nickel transport system permease protein
VRIGTKLAGLLGTIVLVSMLTFLLTQLLPGDPVVSVLGSAYDTKTPTGQAQIALVRKELGLDKPLPVRYLDWVGKAARGDLGRSFGANSGGIKTTRILKERFPITLELMILTQLVAIGLAIPLGVYSAYRQGKLLDKIITWGSFATLSLPGFVLALILVYVFAVKLRWLPTGGYTRLTADLGQNLKSVIIPVLTLSLGLAAVYARLIRSEMVSTLQEDPHGPGQGAVRPSRVVPARAEALVVLAAHRDRHPDRSAHRWLGDRRVPDEHARRRARARRFGWAA